MHPNYLGDIERGRRNPSLQNLQKIARGLKRLPGDLLPSAKEGPAIASSDTANIYLHPRPDKDALALLKALKYNSEKDRRYIIALAKSLSKKLR